MLFRSKAEVGDWCDFAELEIGACMGEYRNHECLVLIAVFHGEAGTDIPHRIYLIAVRGCGSGVEHGLVGVEILLGCQVVAPFYKSAVAALWLATICRDGGESE